MRIQRKQQEVVQMPDQPTADKVIKRVTVILEGREWPLVITHNVLIDCEEMTGLNVLTGGVNLARPSATLIRALLFLSLRRAGAKYTLAQVGDMVHPGNMAEIMKGLGEAWKASNPDPEPEPEEDGEQDPNQVAATE